MTAESAFESFKNVVYKNQWRGTIVLDTVAGGIPSDPKVAEGWLKAKMDPSTKDQDLRDMVVKAMIARGVVAEDGTVPAAAIDEAVAEASALKHLNGFKRDKNVLVETVDDETGEISLQPSLYIEGRQLKSCIKEAANIAWAKERWGPTKKGTRSFFAEHVFVTEDHLVFNRGKADYINQRFVSTFRGTGIQYEEILENATIDFTMISDYDFKGDEIATLWVTAEQNGLGASRSQGFGRFAVTKWEQV